MAVEHPHDPHAVARERAQRRPQPPQIPVHVASVTGHTGRMTSATSTATAAVADAVAGYASRFHAAVGARHHVASPLGAWLLLALIGGAPEALGMPAADAARHARRLLDDPHPAVATATAAWTRDAPPAAAEWLAGLPAAVARGPVPTQDDADAWARRHTLGLIDHFPLTIDREVLCVLANALATRISWTHPFATTGSDTFRSDWRERVRTVLRAPEKGHECGIARHPVAGDVGVHRARAEGLAVTSVVAAADVPAEAVMAAAHDAARDRVPHVSLAELPLGGGPAWSITESTGTGDRVGAVLPAWSATSEHDLRAPAFGFDGAAARARAALRRGPVGRRPGRDRAVPPRRLRGRGGHGRRGADELPAAGQAAGGRAAVRPALRRGRDGHRRGPVGGAAGLLGVGGGARRRRLSPPPPPPTVSRAFRHGESGISTR